MFLRDTGDRLLKMMITTVMNILEMNLKRKNLRKKKEETMMSISKNSFSSMISSKEDKDQLQNQISMELQARYLDMRHLKSI